MKIGKTKLYPCLSNQATEPKINTLFYQKSINDSLREGFVLSAGRLSKYGEFCHVPLGAVLYWWNCQASQLPLISNNLLMHFQSMSELDMSLYLMKLGNTFHSFFVLIQLLSYETFLNNTACG